jgi:hypothetical protein
MTGILVFFINSITSNVCFLTPSIAETTSIIKSVTDAPLSLIFVNASWPGVSINVILFPWQLILNAPIFCVIPPS